MKIISTREIEKFEADGTVHDTIPRTLIDDLKLAGGACVKEGDFGCRKERCWARCYGPGSIFLLGFAYDWCYTTGGNRYSGKFVTCKNKYDCNPCWPCGGICGP